MPIIDIVDDSDSKKVIGTEDIFFYKWIPKSNILSIGELPRTYITLKEVNASKIDGTPSNYYIGKAEWNFDYDTRYRKVLIEKYNLIASAPQVHADAETRPLNVPKALPLNASQTGTRASKSGTKISKSEPTDMRPDSNKLLDALKRIIFSHKKIKSNEDLTKYVKSIGICIDNSSKEIKKAIGTARRILFQEINNNTPTQGEDAKTLEDALRIIVGNYDSILGFANLDMAIETIGMAKKHIENEMLRKRIQLNGLPTEITDSIIIYDTITISIAMFLDM